MRGFCTILISIVALFAAQVLPDFECCNAELVTPYGDVIEEISQTDFSDFPAPICVQSTSSQRVPSTVRRVVSHNKSSRVFSASIVCSSDCCAAIYTTNADRVVATNNLSTVFKWHKIRI